ncbi:hypothetical protein CYMTET_35448 [Cymbomonas tetramitiformis]|uniref:Uncharacterized protein n=1 Tax=Cymbomonas tetramitiformis TaxID=36881 RepID=A0AAE0KP46_9CHLO|nr:hypothetical protein CYMTET_35448 [Cymbomonas tetramitiformis]
MRINTTDTENGEREITPVVGPVGVASGAAGCALGLLGGGEHAHVSGWLVGGLHREARERDKVRAKERMTGGGMNG